MSPSPDSPLDPGYTDPVMAERIRRMRLGRDVDARLPGSAGPGFAAIQPDGQFQEPLPAGAMQPPQASGNMGLGTGQPQTRPSQARMAPPGLSPVAPQTGGAPPPATGAAPPPASATPTARQAPPGQTNYSAQMAPIQQQVAALSTPVGQPVAGQPGVTGQRPMLQSKGVGPALQRVAMALLSATKFAPYAQQIVHPQFTQQMASNQAQLEGLQSQLGVLKEQSTAQEQQAHAAYFQDLPQARRDVAEETAQARRDVAETQTGQRKDAAFQRYIDTILKPFGEDWQYQPDEAEVPAGYRAIPDKVNPGYSYVMPPARMPVPEDDTFLKFLPGRKPGDQIPYAEFKQAQAAAQKDTIQNIDKPKKPAALNQVSIAVRAEGGDPEDPSTITPELAARVSKRLQKNPDSIQLTPDAVAFWAQYAAQGGTLPSMGMGNSGAQARQQIINAAPQYAGGAPLVANRADVRSDQNSLANSRKMLDAVTAFEGTAGRNLDLFLQTAQPIVDSGSPWINRPLRAIDQTGLGSTDLAAYNAARQVALTEIAKVVTNPSLSSVLSDSARRDVMDLVPASATLGQVTKVASIIRQDMANRRIELNNQVQAIRGRLATPPGGATSPPTGGGTPPPAGGDMVMMQMPDGRTGPVHRLQVEKFKKDHPGSKEVTNGVPPAAR